MTVIELMRILRECKPGSEIFLEVACLFHDDGKLELQDMSETVEIKNGPHRQSIIIKSGNIG